MKAGAVIKIDLRRKLLQRDEILTFSNFLSFLRLILAGFLYSAILYRKPLLALILAIVAIVSDFLDGYVARKRNEISEWGKILDPIGDKLCIALGSIALYQSYGLPLWIVAVVIGRDVLILLGALFLIGRQNFITPSALPGKITVTIISFLLLSYILELRVLHRPLEILTIIFIIASASHYAYRFYQNWRRRETTGISE